MCMLINFSILFFCYIYEGFICDTYCSRDQCPEELANQGRIKLLRFYKKNPTDINQKIHRYDLWHESNSLPTLTLYQNNNNLPAKVGGSFCPQRSKYVAQGFLLFLYFFLFIYLFFNSHSSIWLMSSWILHTLHHINWHSLSNSIPALVLNQFLIHLVIGTVRQ